ncbi:MAG: pantoate--beta-alanine ligase [Sedimentisphaerales bacterium]|nr:pantoate--beta-alanine ligase [Sedimentisphaerales bacterium]
MDIAETIDQARQTTAAARRAGRTVGLVPTMGALHEGHLSLIRRCRSECDLTAVSLFVNPTQFAPGEDFDRYPRSFAADRDACAALGVDLLFAPSAGQMYPGDLLTWVHVNRITDHLCGATRPGFFDGVCTVVAKLFHIIQPDRAYFGEKDAQQLAVVTRMVADLDFPVEIRACPIVRDADGLALSSRNRYLDLAQRRSAVCLSRALEQARRLVAAGQTEATALIETIRTAIAREPQARIDYISIVEKEFFQPVTVIEAPCLIALAVYFGTARLIDNITVDPSNQRP